jgi:hypothetical protein
MSKQVMFISSSPNPARDTFKPADQDAVPHGGTFEVEDEAYEALVGDPHIAPLLKEVDTDYAAMSRAELEEAASNAGVPNPDDLEAFPTVGSLAAAIETAGEVHEEPTAPEAEAPAAEPEQAAPSTPAEGGAE